MKYSLLFAAFTCLFSFHQEAGAALSFNITTGGTHGWPGYDTIPVTSSGDYLGSGQLTGPGGGIQGLVREANGDLTFAANAAVGGVTEWYADIQIENVSTPGINGWVTDINEIHIWYEIVNTIPVPRTDITATYKGVTRLVGSGGQVTFKDLHLEGVADPLLSVGDAPETVRFTFSGYGPQLGFDSAIQLNNISFTAVVPEPSSALLLTSILGLFGTCFRKRRRLVG